MSEQSAEAQDFRSFSRPARVGDRIEDVETPALLIDMDALERNLETMRRYVEEAGVTLRGHAKCHKSADLARLQIEKGGATGVCCQKPSEAEALAAAGIGDILVSNQAPGRKRADRLARIAQTARISVCVDHLSNIPPLSEAAVAAGVEIGCLVEVETGMGRCGAAPGLPVVPLAKAIDKAAGLRFEGIQAYQGAAQHAYDYRDRKALMAVAIAAANQSVEALRGAGIPCPTVTGGGTGTFPLEAKSGVYTELQCGSYVFMDVDYGGVLGEDGAPLGMFENALFVLTEVISKNRPGAAVCDAGLKALSVDSGLPRPSDVDGVRYVGPSDEHGVLEDPHDVLSLGRRFKLIPGHCDPTCNLYDWYVCMRGGVVEAVWPVTARGMVL